MNDRHTKSNFNEPDSRGKRDLKNAKSHFRSWFNTGVTK
jgi:hypothetical protein